MNDEFHHQTIDNSVDLCSGIGGFSLGFSWAELSKTIMFCDTEEWCRKILAKNFNNVPIAKDVKELANDPERLVPNHDISHVDTHANHSVSADLEKEKKTTDTSGRSCLKLLHAKDPLGSFAKTFMVTLPWASTKCCLT